MTCRLCGGGDIESVADLGLQRPSGHFPGLGDPPRRGAPLHVVACRRCGLAQLTETLPPEQQFCGAYGYRSGVNETMVEHLAGLARHAVELRGGAEPRAVLDIGCNDGTLLRSFPGAFTRIGIDPSPWILEADGVGQWKGFFPEVSPTHLSFDLVLSVAMFYDIDDPVAAARRVRQLLAPDGVWVCEVADWSRLVAEGVWDGICHEHLTYWTDDAMLRLAGLAGLEVFSVTRNDCNGGSVRYAMRRAGEHAPSQLHGTAPPPTAADLARFGERVAASARDIASTVRQYLERGQTVHLYGASTKANVVLQACGLGPAELACASERSPVKVGRTTATGVPIVSELDSRALRPDAYLVGPWHFRRAILRRELSAWHAGTDFVFPLPSVTVAPGHVNRLALPRAAKIGAP